MQREEVIENVQDICHSLIVIAEQQRRQYQAEKLQGKATNATEPVVQESIQNPASLSAARIMAQPKALQYMLLDGFWAAYKVVIDDLNSAAIAFAIRPLTEIAFRHLLYLGLEEDEGRRKEMAIKYYLLTVADMPEYASQAEFTETYKALIQEISCEKERGKYEKLMARGFREKDIGYQMLSVFPGFGESRLIERIKPYLVGIGTSELDEKTPGILMHRFSNYVHANAITLHGMQKQDTDKSYLFSHTAILFMLGYRVAEFTNDRLLKVKLPIGDIYQRMIAMHKDIEAYQSRNFPPNGHTTEA